MHPAKRGEEKGRGCEAEDPSCPTAPDGLLASRVELHDASLDRAGKALLLFRLVLLLLARRPGVDVVLVSLPKAGTHLHGRWRRRSGLRRRWRGGLNRSRGRRWRLRSRRRLHSGLPRRVSRVTADYRLGRDPRARLGLNGYARRGDPRDQRRAAGAASASAPVARRPRHDRLLDRARSRLDEQQRVKRTLGQAEAKCRRRSREDPLHVTRLERRAPEVTRRRSGSHERRQSKRLSGDDHAASMRFAPDGAVYATGSATWFFPCSFAR